MNENNMCETARLDFIWFLGGFVGTCGVSARECVAASEVGLVLVLFYPPILFPPLCITGISHSCVKFMQYFVFGVVSFFGG